MTRLISYREHPAYLARDVITAPKSTLIGQEGCWGSRWFHGPLCFDRWTSDTEPTIVRDGQSRLAIWQPISRTDRPKGWWPGLRGMSIGNTGYAELSESGPYDKTWTSHARRHHSTWRKSKWVIREISDDAYMRAYAGSSQDVILRSLNRSLLAQKLKTGPELVHIYGAMPYEGGPVEAGFVCADVPETSESLHMMSFFRPAARVVSAGTGLMAHWFETAPARNIRYLDFGVFWRPGDPNSWKGFSRFKSQFGVRYVEYPTPLVRLVWGKK